MPRKKKEEVVKERKYSDFDLRNLPHLGDTSFEKLSNAGITTVFDVMIRGSNEIQQIAPLPDAHMSSVILNAYNEVMNSGICRPSDMSLVELAEYKSKIPKLLTNCNAFDDMLGGGVEREALTEIYGENGVGKTQTCFTLAVEAIEQWDTDVIWIDVEDTLEPDRLVEIITSRGYAKDRQQAMDKFFPRIIHRTCPNTDIINMEIEKITQLFLEKRPKLMILDGVTGQFRAEYLGRGTLAGRQQNLNRFLHILTNLAFYFSCAIIYTNQVQADPSAPPFMNPTKPIGGNIVGHVSKRRINLVKRGSKRVARLEKSSKDALEEVYYQVTEKGIIDV